MIKKTLTKLLRNARNSVDFDPMAKSTGELVPAKAVSKELKADRPAINVDGLKEITLDEFQEIALDATPKFDSSKYVKPSLDDYRPFKSLDYGEGEEVKNRSRLVRYNEIMEESHDSLKEEPYSKTHKKKSTSAYMGPQPYSHGRNWVDRRVQLPTGGGSFSVNSWRTQMREYGLESIYMSIIDPKRFADSRLTVDYIGKDSKLQTKTLSPLHDWMSGLTTDTLEVPYAPYGSDKGQIIQGNIHEVYNSIAKGEFTDIGGMVEHFKKPIAEIRNTPRGMAISEMVVGLIKDYAEHVKSYINQSIDSPNKKVEVSQEHIKLLADIKNLYLVIKNPEIAKDIASEEEWWHRRGHQSRVYRIASYLSKLNTEYKRSAQVDEYSKAKKSSSPVNTPTENLTAWDRMSRRHEEYVERKLNAVLEGHPPKIKQLKEALLLEAEIEYYRQLESMGYGRTINRGVLNDDESLREIIRGLEKKLEDKMRNIEGLE